MADGHHFESSFIAISQPLLSDFDQIWYADTNFQSEDRDLTKNQNFVNSRWWTDAILKIVFWLYLGDGSKDILVVFSFHTADRSVI